MTEEELKKKTIAFVSLGCDKNRVDLEKMIFKIRSAGFSIVEDSEKAKIVLINTCAFIESARKEAIEHILAIAQLKKRGLEKIIVTGCMAEKHFLELKETMPEIDAVLKLRENKDIIQKIYKMFNVPFKKMKQKEGRVLTTPSHYAYLKIADGCNNCCSYCTIPRIRGRYISEKMEDLVSEAKNLCEMGVKELILVAQDTTRYGMDLYGEPKLIALLEKLTLIKGIERIRLLYCYPEMVTNELLNYISHKQKICAYLDIPFQHFTDDILSSMNRRTTSEDILNLVKKIRSQTRKFAIRSTFIVGYPGETRSDFSKLIKFLKLAKLDNVGFFKYSREEGTKACYMKGQVREFHKKLRLAKAQKVQEKIVNEKAQARIGEIVSVIIDDFDINNGNYIARDEFNAPDVDFQINIKGDKPLEIGSIQSVKLTGYKNYIYKGELIL